MLRRLGLLGRGAGVGASGKLPSRPTLTITFTLTVTFTLTLNLTFTFTLTHQASFCVTKGKPFGGFYSFVEDFARTGKSTAQLRRAQYGPAWTWSMICTRMSIVADTDMYTRAYKDTCA